MEEFLSLNGKGNNDKFHYKMKKRKRKRNYTFKKPSLERKRLTEFQKARKKCKATMARRKRQSKEGKERLSDLKS